ncbi:MAG: DUF3618 domain-containing protein [Kofleriaceae bacterium]
MGNKTTSITGASQDAAPDDPAMLRAQIAETRNEMSDTIEELHGRLNPAVLKDQAIDQFHEATATVKAELKAHFQEAKQALKDELTEAKASIKAEVVEEIDAVKTRFSEEVTQAKAAVREATIGKVENMVHGAQERVRDVRRSVTDTIKDNPIPAALAGIGLAWLLIEARRKRQREDRGYRQITAGARDRYRGSREMERTEYGRSYQDDDDGSDSMVHQAQGLAQRTGRKLADGAQGAASAVGHFAHDARDTVTDAAHRAREVVGDTVSGAAHRVQDVAHRAREAVGDTVSGAAHRVQDTATGLARGAGDGARRVGRRSSELYRDNPLAVGAAVLALGTIVGLAMPRTDREDEWMGSARDRVFDRAEELAHDAMEKVGEAVEQFGGETESSNGSTQGQASNSPRV